MTLRVTAAVLVMCGLAAAQRVIELKPTTERIVLPTTEPITELIVNPTTGPATGPATRTTTRLTTRPVSRPATGPTIKISPEAQTLLNELSKAYTSAKSLELAGTISSEVDVAGTRDKQSAPFSAVYQAPNKFRHEVLSDMLSGCWGEKAFMFKSQPNMYKLMDMPKEKPVVRAFPRELGRLLEAQNPSLLLAMLKDPADGLKQGVEEIARPADVTVDGKAYNVLKLTAQKGQIAITILVDPGTHLIKRSTLDTTKEVAARGAHDTKLVVTSVDYTRTVLDGKPNVQFAWTPPAGARDAGLSGSSAIDDASPTAPAAASAMMGKPAPDFKLTGLDGKEVTLEQLHGSVAVLIFWSVGAGPSATAMPLIERLYAQKGPAGLKVYAINVKEDGRQIKAFTDKVKMTVPILLDDGTAQTAYGAEPLPMTVVMDKDGVVRKVLAGAADDMEKQLRDAVEAALGGK